MGAPQINEFRKRASEQLPSVLLTLLSIIQAIALESLWSHAVEYADRASVSLVSVVGWFQVANTLMVIVFIWLLYVAHLMRFLWTPALSDTALPILVGLVQFALIEFAVPDRLGYWFIALGVLTVIVTGIDHRFVKKARRDPRNVDFFESVSPATWRDFAPQFVYVIAAFVAGTIFLVAGPASWLAIACMMLIVAALIHNAYVQVRYWNQSIREN